MKFRLGDQKSTMFALTTGEMQSDFCCLGNRRSQDPSLAQTRFFWGPFGYSVSVAVLSDPRASLIKAISNGGVTVFICSYAPCLDQGSGILNVGTAQNQRLKISVHVPQTYALHKFSAYMCLHHSRYRRQNLQS